LVTTATLIDQSEVEASKLLSGVKQYRPRQTVFEIHRTGAKVSGVAADVMKKKREAHTGAIEKHTQMYVCRPLLRKRRALVADCWVLCNLYICSRPLRPGSLSNT
jgi:hypothetical protein